MKRDFALIRHSHNLGELLDVDLTGIVDNSLIQYDSASGEWQDVSLASLNSQLDHGLLLGLADDDHTQYVLRSILTANGDLFTRTAGVIARLGVGSGSNVLAITAGLPAWRTLTSADISDFNEAAQDTIGGALTDSSSIDFTYNDGAGTFTASTINANPTASVGLTAVNGSAATPMRSDGAPALSQAIAPTWTGNHTFTPASGNTTFHAGNVLLDLDSQELQLGASQDLRLYHDGTNCFIRADTGELRFNIGSTTTLAVGGTPGYFLVRRASQSTSEVGFGIQGGSSGVDWYWYQGVSSNVLHLYQGANLLDVTTSRFSFLRPVNLPSYIVSTLPTGSAGDTAFVTDALGPTFGAAVVGLGAVSVPVYYDTGWKVG